MRRLIVSTAVLAAFVAGAAVIASPGGPARKTVRFVRAPVSRLAPTGGAGTGSARTGGTGGPTITWGTSAPQLTPPLRSVRPAPLPVVERLPEAERLIPHQPPPDHPVVDPVLQRSAPTGLMPASTSFAGNAFTESGCGCLPPDTTGDVGPTQYVQWTNTVIGVFNKITGARLLLEAGNTPWLSLNNPCATTNQGDPIVQYDQLAGRWVLSQFAFTALASDGFWQCVAVSTSSDATGSYNAYAFRLSNTVFNDYGKLGVWPDAYYLSINEFAGLGGPYLGPGVVAFDRAAMIAGTSASFVYIDPGNPGLAPALPADLQGANPPPAGAPNPFVLGPYDGGTDGFQLYRFHVDFTTPLSSTFTLATNLFTAAFDSDMCFFALNCIPQPGTTTRLDAISDRPMYRLDYRRFSGGADQLVFNHTVDVTGGDQAGIRWYQIDNPTGSPSIGQQGTFAPDTDNRWLGSAGTDKKGDIAVGYSVSSGTTFPSVRYAGRLVTDPANALGQGEATMIAGSASQNGNGGSPVLWSRWGDYSTMSIDPLDDCTFWYTNEYYAGPNPPVPNPNYQTRIGHFVFPQCLGATAVVVERFGARWTRSGASLTWRTAAETRVLGFNVFRADAKGRLVRLNRALIPARRGSGTAYRFLDRVARRSHAVSYRLQIVNVDGGKSWYGAGAAP